MSYINLGILLMNFFDLYGNKFCYENVAIRVTGSGSYFKKIEKEWFYPQRPFLISVENPVNTSLEVGKNSYKIRKAKLSFSLAYAQLNVALCKLAKLLSSPPYSTRKAVH